MFEFNEMNRRSEALEDAIDRRISSMNGLIEDGGRGQQNNATKRPQFEKLDRELTEQFGELSSIYQQMSSYVEVNRHADWMSTALHHKLQRHADCIRDFQVQYKRVRDTASAILDREFLFAKIKEDKSEPKMGGNRASAHDYYLQESTHISFTDRLLDEQLGMANATKENLTRQRLSMNNIRARMFEIAQKFPMVNNVLQKIQRRKRQDAVVLGLTISVCIFVLYLFW
ncbi:unnamed protein product, partial [Mesorhabditis spiculigera]